ncbi:MAG: hypothetical protein LBT90_01450 [Holosporaceae bacterium]|nr:hypothetical protein [Holosporaceae bacterium]
MTKEGKITDTTDDFGCACEQGESCSHVDQSGVAVITENMLKEALLRNDEEWQKRLLLAVLIMLIIVVGQ